MHGLTGFGRVPGLHGVLPRVAPCDSWLMGCVAGSRSDAASDESRSGSTTRQLRAVDVAAPVVVTAAPPGPVVLPPTVRVLVARDEGNYQPATFEGNEG